MKEDVQRLDAAAEELRDEVEAEQARIDRLNKLIDQYSKPAASNTDRGAHGAAQVNSSRHNSGSSRSVASTASRGSGRTADRTTASSRARTSASVRARAKPQSPSAQSARTAAGGGDRDGGGEGGAARSEGGYGDSPSRGVRAAQGANVGSPTIRCPSRASASSASSKRVGSALRSMAVTSGAALGRCKLGEFPTADFDAETEAGDLNADGAGCDLESRRDSPVSKRGVLSATAAGVLQRPRTASSDIDSMEGDGYDEVSGDYRMRDSSREERSRENSYADDDNDEEELLPAPPLRIEPYARSERGRAGVPAPLAVPAKPTEVHSTYSSGQRRSLAAQYFAAKDSPDRQEDSRASTSASASASSSEFGRSSRSGDGTANGTPNRNSQQRQQQQHQSSPKKTMRI